jgi:large subunit ribosomal protein L25
MKTIELKGSARSVTGKAAMKKIRREGNVPAVIYGQGEPAPVSVGFQALNKVLLSAETYVVNLDIDGKAIPAIVREAQFHPVTDHVLHVDFLRVNDSHPVDIDLPIKLVGTCKGVLAGGKLVPMLRRLKVRGLVSQLPAVIEIDISHLDLGKSIRVGEVNLPGIEVKSPASAGLAIVEIPRAVKTADDGKK